VNDDDPFKTHPSCPIMVVLILALLYHLYVLKDLEKKIAVLELYQKARKILDSQPVKKEEPKQEERQYEAPDKVVESYEALNNSFCYSVSEPLLEEE